MYNALPLAAAIENPLWPFAILAIGILVVITLIGYVRLHAFVALILSAFLVGFLSKGLPVAEGSNHYLTAIKMTLDAFGRTASSIGWVIGLAAITGACLMQSGAADRIVRAMVRLLGEKRAGPAMVLCSFFLSVPVFFDTVFFLMIPLARALAYRLGKNYVFFVVAVCCGGTVAHALVPPTPGPLAMAEILQLDLGLTIIAGVALGIGPAFAGLWFGHRLDRKMNIQVRETAGVKIEDIETIVNQRDDELPSFFLSTLPVMLPVGLIAFASFLNLWITEGAFYDLMIVLGNQNIAMLAGTIIALFILAKQKNLSIRSVGGTMNEPLRMAGLVILITAAGGAFGKMLSASGVGEAIRTLSDGTGISLILLAWIVSSVLKLAQGSGTVTMLTTAGIMASVLQGGAELPYHPIYIFAAIAFGSEMCSWMNGSGFWVVCKMGGFTVQENLKIWTASLSILGLVGIAQVLILSAIFPFPFGTP